MTLKSFLGHCLPMLVSAWYLATLHHCPPRLFSQCISDVRLPNGLVVHNKTIHRSTLSSLGQKNVILVLIRVVYNWVCVFITIWDSVANYRETSSKKNEYGAMYNRCHSVAPVIGMLPRYTLGNPTESDKACYFFIFMRNST